MIKKTKEEGITIIALVVTIIVLLILVGVAIATLGGENGIVTKAKEASTKSVIKGEEEQIILARTAATMLAESENREVMLEDIDNELKTQPCYETSKIIREGEESYIDFQTKEKNVYYITVNEIKYQGKVDELVPLIEKVELTSTVSTITVKVEAKRAEGAKYTYYIGSSQADLKEIGVAEIGEYTYTKLKPATNYYIKVIVTTGSGSAEKIEQKLTVNNVAPLMDSVNLSSKTPTTLNIQSKATDSDGDKVVHKLYINNELKATSKEVNSGEVVTLTVQGLSNYTTYYYYVEVSDPYNIVKGTTSSARTQCSGQTSYCSGSYSCTSGYASYCSGTENKGTYFCRCTKCSNMGFVAGQVMGGTCGWNGCTGVWYNTYDPICLGSDCYNHSNPCYHSPCSHGYSYYHTIYSNYCSHGYTYSHCSHYKTSSHYNCSHSNSGAVHD